MTEHVRELLEFAKANRRNMMLREEDRMVLDLFVETIDIVGKASNEQVAAVAEIAKDVDARSTNTEPRFHMQMDAAAYLNTYSGESAWVVIGADASMNVITVDGVEVPGTVGAGSGLCSLPGRVLAERAAGQHGLEMIVGIDYWTCNQVDKRGNQVGDTTHFTFEGMRIEEPDA